MTEGTTSERTRRQSIQNQHSTANGLSNFDGVSEMKQQLEQSRTSTGTGRVSNQQRQHPQ